MNENIKRLATRVNEDPFFLGSALEMYKRSEGIDEEGLAKKCGCSVETLDHLRLCRNPSTNSAEFWDDVEKIASRFQLDPDALAEVVRHSHNVARLQNEAAKAEMNSQRFFLAARDSAPPETEDDEQ